MRRGGAVKRVQLVAGRLFAAVCAPQLAHYDDPVDLVVQEQRVVKICQVS